MKTGDKVRLKSGGPVMTVTLIGAYTIRCMWFDGYTLRSGDFPVDALAKVGNRKL